MVDAISSFDPLAYLNQIKGISAPAATTPSTATSDSDTDTSTDSSTSASPSSTSATGSTTSATNPLGLSANLVSLLQSVNSSSTSTSNPVSALYNSSAIDSTDPLAGVYSTLLYTASSTAPLQQAVAATQQQQATSQATNTDPLQSILATYNSGLNAYNQTLLQNAQSVLAANSGADVSA